MTILHPRECLTRNIRTCQFRVYIIDRATVLTERESNRIPQTWVLTLARKYNSFPSNIYLMNESLRTKRIDNAIECREIHTVFCDEELLQIRKSDTRILRKYIDEATALESNTRIWHTKGDEKMQKIEKNLGGEYNYIFFHCKFLQKNTKKHTLSIDIFSTLTMVFSYSIKRKSVYPSSALRNTQVPFFPKKSPIFFSYLG